MYICFIILSRDFFFASRQTSNTGDIDYIRARFTAFPNFPKPGVNFLDIFSVLQDPVASQKIINLFVDFIRENHGKVRAWLAHSPHVIYSEIHNVIYPERRKK